MLGRSLKMAFWIFHDHLGLLLAANFIWALTVAVPLGLALPPLFAGDGELALVIGIPSIYIGLFLCAPVLGAAITHLIKTLIDTRDAGLSDFFVGVRLYGVRAAALGLCYAVLTVAFCTSAWFYATKLGDTFPIAGYGISALAVWGLAFVGFTTVYALPALVQKKKGAIATLRLSAQLVLAHPILTIGIAIQCLLLTFVAIAVLPLLLAGYGALVLCITSAAYELLARKYAPADSPADSHSVPNDDYLNRSLRDLFFPWKY